jgi:hypothetical protein
MIAIYKEQRRSTRYIVLQASFPMSSTTSPHTSADAPAPPEWATISHEVKCPLCDYNLRGLSDPRCPECGCGFDWAAVLDPANRLHPYLFEHHPERNIRSFAQTLIHHLTPFQFWKTLDPTHRLRPRRILLYWAVYALIAFAPAVIVLVELVQYRLRWGRPNRGLSIYLNVMNQTFWSKEGFTIGLAALLLAVFPWFNFLALMIFQQSMRRARIKPAHVLRCAVYSGDVIFWYALAAAVAILCLPARPRAGQTEQLMLLLTLGAFLAGLLNAVRLWIAYARYMKFKRPLAAVFASQIIVALTLFTILMYVAEA